MKTRHTGDWEMAKDCQCLTEKRACMAALAVEWDSKTKDMPVRGEEPRKGRKAKAKTKRNLAAMSAVRKRRMEKKQYASIWRFFFSFFALGRF